MKTKKITGVATAALLASVAVPVTNNLANIQTSYTAKAVTGQQQAFLNTAIPNAEAASARYGTYTSVMLAQSILESGWGASLLATQANNLFGMKGSYNGQTYYTNTSEWASGTGYYNINAGFRKYPSWAASFEDNGYKLRTGTTDNPSRYRMAWIENAANYQVATQGLKDGGYATSPTYPQSLNRVISSYGLNQYDPSVDTTTKTMRVLSNGTVYSGPADSSVVSATGNITAGQVVTVDKTVTYKNGLSYMHISNGWINGSLLTGSSTQATTTEKAGTTTDAGNAAIKVVYTSAIAEWKNPGSGVVGYLQKGTTQTVVGKIQVNGAWWYKLSSGNWVPGEYVYVTGASRIPTIDNNVVNQNTKVKIKYISGYSIAVWSNPAIGTTGQYLKDGTEVQTIGYTTANGKKWYKLANNTWIPAEYTKVVSSSTVVTNITNESNTVAINYPHYSIAVWSEPGRNSTGKYLSDGTKVQTVGYTTVNGKKWYKLADNTWIPAEYTKVVSSSTVVTNITNESNTVAINYPHYSIAVWGEPGKNSTGKYLSDGTKVQTVGYTTVNGKKWYKLADNTWIPAEYTKAVSSTDTTSGNNTVTVNYPGYSIVVWSEPGRNSTGKYISDGTSVKYYATANYNGQTWYKIGENQWVPGQYVKVNASNNSGSVTVKYISGYGIAIWSNPGRNSTGKYLENGTTVKYFETQNYNGQTWYKIGENQWVPAQYVSVN